MAQTSAEADANKKKKERKANRLIKYFKNLTAR
jgi:hypothetical protein